MIFKKIVLILFLGMFLAAGPSRSAADSPATQAAFSSVTGKVTLQAPGEKEKKTVHSGSTAREGDRVATGKNSSATLRLFDGSQLEIGAESSLVLSRLQKPSTLDKIFRFKLLVGELMATVKKLATAKSSFEIEAGGVVCGVRGTVYQMKYSPSAQTLDLKVLEGTVFTQVNGGTPANYTAGQSMNFTHVLGLNSKNNVKGGAPGKEVNTNGGTGGGEPGKSVNTNKGSGGGEPGKEVNTNKGSGGEGKGGADDPSNYGHGGNSGNNATGSSPVTADITLAGGPFGGSGPPVILPGAGGFTLTSNQPATIAFNPNLILSNPGLPGGAVTLTLGAPPTIMFNTGVTLTGVQALTATPSNPVGSVVTFNPTLTGPSGGASFITFTNPGTANPSLTFTVTGAASNPTGPVIFNPTNSNILSLGPTYQVTSGKPKPGAGSLGFTISVNGGAANPPITFTVAGGNPGAANPGFTISVNGGATNPPLTFTVAGGATNPALPFTFTLSSPTNFSLVPGFTITNLGPTSANLTVVSSNPIPSGLILDNPALVSLNNTFLRGVLVNADNNLAMANQHQAIELVVP